MSNKTSFNLEKNLEKENNETFSLTKEARIQNKSKWELFLEGYKNYYNSDFSWTKYIKDCKLYYGEFNIRDFIKTYGPECEEDFKNFRNQLLVKKGINKDHNSTLNNLKNDKDIKLKEIDPKLLELMSEADAIRTRLLIRFLNPQNRIEKKNLKKSWKLAKRNGLSKDEWMKSYVGINFTHNKLDVLDDKYTREEVFEILKIIKAKIESEPDNKNDKALINKEHSSDLEKSNDFKKENDYSSIENISTTKLFDEFEEEKIKLNKENFQEEFNNQNPKNNFLVLDKNSNESFELFENKKIPENNDPNNKIINSIDFEKHVDDQINLIQQDREFITQELKKANQIKLAEERRYEKLRQERQKLTKDLEDEKIFAISNEYDDYDEF